MATNNPSGLFWDAVSNNDTAQVSQLLSQSPELAQLEQNGWTALMDAANRGNLDMAYYLLSWGADINALGIFPGRDTYYSPLILAASQNNTAMVDFLMSWSADINKTDPDGNTALVYSSQLGHVECSSLLLQHGADPNIANQNGDSALTFAAATGSYWLLYWLLSYHADVNFRDSSGETALMILSRKGYEDCVRYLALQVPGTDCDLTESNGNNALMLSAVKGHTGIFNILLQQTRNINHTNNQGRTAAILSSHHGRLDCVRSLHQRGADLNVFDGYGHHAILHAACEGHADVLNFLLQVNNNYIDYETLHGETALTISSFRGHAECVRVLLTRGADPHRRNLIGSNALLFAALGNKIEILTILLSPPYLQGCNLNHQNFEGQTALMYAAKNGHLGCVRFLHRKGADIHVQDVHGNNALILAAGGGSLGHVRTIYYLIQQGSSIDHMNHDGHTALMTACMSGYIRVVQALYRRDAHDLHHNPAVVCAVLHGHQPVMNFLLEQGIDVDIQYTSGMTALMHAAHMGRYQCASDLIERGADIRLRDDNGLTARQWAENAQKDRIVAMLRNAEANPRR